MGLILGVLFEYIIFFYYSDTTLYHKRRFIIRFLTGLVGYSIIFIVAVWGNIIFNIILCTTINILLLKFNYSISYLNAVFKGMMIYLISIIGEAIACFVLRIGMTPESLNSMPWQKSMLITMAGRTLGLIGIVIFKRITGTKYENSIQKFPVLVLIPIITLICIIIIFNTTIDNNSFVSLSILLFVVNVLTFATHELMTGKNAQIETLQKINEINNIELSGYKLLYDKYEQTRIMRHNMKAQLNVLTTLVKTDHERALKYIEEIQTVNNETGFIEYTDNKILNILLMQKMDECNKKCISLHIESRAPNLYFLSDIDTVAIFSNLLNNAIESCDKSVIKNIYLELYNANDYFVVIKVTNNSDETPIVENRKLVSSKKDAGNHGLGMKSISYALNKYGADMKWKYDKTRKMFFTTIIIKKQPFSTTN